MKDVDADYYGYRDEDDCILVPLEKVSNQIWAFDVLKPSEQLKCIFAGLRPSIMHDAYVCVKPCPLILFQYRASKFEGSWTQTKSYCVFPELSVTVLLVANFRHCFMFIMYLKAEEKKAIAAKVEEYRAKKEAALAGGGGDVMDVEETDIYQVEVWQSAASYSHLLWWLNNFFKVMQCEVI